MKKIVNLIALIAIGFSGCVGTLAKTKLNPAKETTRNVKPEKSKDKNILNKK